MCFESRLNKSEPPVKHIKGDLMVIVVCGRGWGGMHCPVMKLFSTFMTESFLCDSFCVIRSGKLPWDKLEMLTFTESRKGGRLCVADKFEQTRSTCRIRQQSLQGH